MVFSAFTRYSPLFSPKTSEYMLRKPKTFMKYHETELTLKHHKHHVKQTYALYCSCNVLYFLFYNKTMLMWYSMLGNVDTIAEGFEQTLNVT